VKFPISSSDPHPPLASLIRPLEWRREIKHARVDEHHSRLISSSTDKTVPSICVIQVSPTHNKRLIYYLLGSDCSGVQQRDDIALRRTTEVERRVGKWFTVLSVKTTTIMSGPVHRSTTNP
jgi:hypothetical protein